MYRALDSSQQVFAERVQSQHSILAVPMAIAHFQDLLDAQETLFMLFRYQWYLYTEPDTIVIYVFDLLTARCVWT